MDYRPALEQAIIYIEDRLGEAIKVEEVARAAGYSYYHLNRQFSAILGESIGSYIKKRRLASAAKALLYTNKKVIEIALENGFESSESFSRAFKFNYRISPQEYRINRLDTFIASKSKLHTNDLDHLTLNVTTQPTIVMFPQTKIAGIRGHTTLKDNKLAALWQEFNRIATQIPHRSVPGRGFGICEACHENSLYEMSDEVVFTEIAGVEVDSFVDLPEPFVQKILPAGRYAVFTHTGSLRALPQTFQYIWGTWLLNTKEEMDDREDFELYDQRYLGYDHPNSKIDLYIPLK
ncbi:AraC family transcriptional regulator [Paenibacillus sp. ACRSA]|uniref:AraC family transcriptional regulator n=1 Tax=Paenibacillus sp. ACRSA TaxID=2918211 RepID=UPI001EF5A233|nr:AraC family transcriptional regulator [Paenibacillus sp. ACRSA]MCG7377949.1 AraC family transcriptional regulator [Paenibacillus sp. ACRSA]